MLNKREAKAEGARAGRASASWFEPSDRVIQMLEDGDPEADEYMPHRPNLSGEYAGESINEILDVNEDDDPDDIDEIADVYMAAADKAYEDEIQRIIRQYLGPAPRRRRSSAPKPPRYNPRRDGGPRIVTHGRKRR